MLVYFPNIFANDSKDSLFSSTTFPLSVNVWAFAIILANKNKKNVIFFILKNLKRIKRGNYSCN